MRRMVVVLFLFIMMWLLRLAEVPGSSATDPLTLAAIGFVVLAAFAVAELLAQVGLPKVTGYILSGILLGPFFPWGVLSTEVVEQMGMFKTLAVGLIALTAGLELEIKALKKLLRTLLATVGAKVVLAAPLVGAALVAVELSFHPLGLADSNQALALGLVFAALAIGTSPAIALAVVSEAGAKGRLSELVLGAAVLKDLVVVVVLALCVAVAKTLTGGGEAGGSVGLEVLMHVSEELVAGAILGGLLIAYMRWVGAEMLLFLAATVLVVAEFAEAFGLGLLLIFIAAGFVVRNYSDYGHDLHHPLEMVSLPVFVVFFTTAGAAIDIDATLKVLPVALVLVVVRAGGFWLAAFVGNKIGKEDEGVSNNAWFSYLPQAGVTLALVDIAASKLPAIDPQIRSVGMAFVAVNLLGGPLALRAGLERAGELPKDDELDAGDAISSDPSDEPKVPRLVPLEPLSPALEHERDELRERVEGELEQGLSKIIKPWVELRRQAFAGLNAERVAGLAGLAESPPRSDATGLSNALAALYERVANHPQRLDVTKRVPLESSWLAASEGEAFTPRVRRVLRRLAVRLGSRAAKTRELPLRLIAREAFEPRLATAMLELFRSSCRTEARLADTVRRRLEGRLSPDALADTLELILLGFEAEVEAISVSTLEASSRRMHLLLARLDSPAMAIAELDFAEAAQGIERELGALLSEAEQWPQVIDACWQSVEVSARIRRLDDRITSGRDGAAAMAEARAGVDEVLASFGRRLEPMRAQLDGVDAIDESGLDSFSTHARALLPKPASKRLRQAEHKLRKLSESRAVHQALREAAARDTGAKLLVGPELVIAAPVPSQIRPRELDVRELIDGEIAARVLPAAERALAEGARLMSEAQQSAAAMVSDVELLAEVYRRQDGKDATLDNFRTGLERVATRCEQLRVEGLTELDASAEALAAQFEDLGDRLSDTLHAATAGGDPSNWVARRTDRARREVGRELDRLRERLARVGGWASGRLQTLAAVWTSDYRLRSGLSLPSAAALAKLVEVNNEIGLSSDYAALFHNQPIRDPRFFVANREPLKIVTRAERGWQQKRRANAVLVLGGPGSGKSSLLNVAALKLSTRHVLWLPQARGGILELIAAELHCPAQREPVLRRLLDHPRAVIIDDLERHLPVDGSAIEELEILTWLIAETSRSCFWLVSAGAELQQLLARRWPLRMGFSELLELDRLDADALTQVIIARHRISGLELSFPLSPLRRFIARTLGRDPSGQQRNYFARLARASEGNLRAALIEWCRAGTITEQTFSLHHDGRARHLPFVRQLPTSALAILATIVRYGPLARDGLAAALLRERSDLERFVHFLLTAKLLEVDAHGCLACPARVRDVLVRELRELGLFHGGRS